MSLVRVPILTWHAMSVGGSDYGNNQHIAFRDDLETIQRLGLRVLPLKTIAFAIRNNELASLHGVVGLSFDDGSDFDFLDLPHPYWGAQRSMTNIMADFRARHGASSQPELNATSFAIVSPEARRELDGACMIGCGWWNDDWWACAEATGLLDVESHSWDHNHGSMKQTASTVARSGFAITSLTEAQAEIAQASRYLQARRNREAGCCLHTPTVMCLPSCRKNTFRSTSMSMKCWPHLPPSRRR